MRLDELLGKAEALRSRSRHRESLRFFRRALREAEGRQRVECLMATGDTCRMTGDFALAVRHYEEAVELGRAVREPLLVLDASVGLALAKRAMGDWKGSIELLGGAEEAYDKSGDMEGAAFALWARAGALRVKGDIHGAIKAFGGAKRAFSSLGDERGVGYSLCGLGGSLRVKGLFAVSLKRYTEANALFRGLRETFGTAYSHCGMGNALRMKGDYGAAREHFRRAIALYRRIGEIVSYSYTLWSMGKTYMMLRRYGLSERYFTEARRLFRKTGDPRGEIYCRLGLAELKYLAGGLDGARRMLVSARGLAAGWGFAIEECHAEALLSAMEDGAESGCYGRLGLRLGFKGVPFNIP